MKKETPKSNLLARWKNREKKENPTSTILKAPKNHSIPLSYGQQRLWFLQQLHPENEFYNYAESYEFSGVLNTDYLVKSLQFVFNSSDVLRTTYHSIDGETIQKVNEGELDVTFHDLSNLFGPSKEQEKNDIVSTLGTSYFDLSLFPLVRASLIKMEEDVHVLVISMHHIVTDKWSMGLLREQMAAYYTALSEGKPTHVDLERTQYTDYAYWQSQEALDKQQLSYWKNKLSGEIPTLELPTDFTRRGEPSLKGTLNTNHLDDSLSQGVLGLAKELGTTPYVLMLSVYYVLLHKYTGHTDILVGSPISNRKNKQLENLIGFFNNTVVLRSHLKGDLVFTDFVNKVREITLEAFSNNEIPFDVLVKELNPDRSISGNPFFQVMFLYHSVPETPSFGTNISLRHSSIDLEVAKFDLTLYVSEENGRLSTSFEYATDVFEEATINQFQEHYELLLRNIVGNPEEEISKIDMLTPREQQLFLPEKIQISKPYQKYTGIHEIIEAAAVENSDRNAVIFGDHKITYRELIAAANKCASEILSITKGQNRIIGLCAERSIEMAIGILGILKAGCAYLPLDPEYPSERVEFMLADAKVDTVLMQKGLQPLFDNFGGTALHFENIAKKDVVKEINTPISEESIAYVIYTSGSTGKPKGVPIRHRNIIESTESRLAFYSEAPSVFLLLSSMAFDSSKAGIFWTLCTGGTLVIGEKHIEQDLLNLGILIEKNDVSHTLMLPSLYNLCLENCSTEHLKSLQTVIVAGEASSVTLVKSHFENLPEVKLYNEYGPTEGTVWCIAHRITPNDTETVPIGKPVTHSEVYLLNVDNGLVPFGGIGEICIAGPGLAGSYLNRPELTEQAYVDHPFKKEGNQKLYKTGDLGRYNVDGNIEFLGRNDQQVKIRGHRIEIDEVEKGVLALDAVLEAIVLVQKVNEAKQLFGYVLLKENIDIESIKADLSEKFPKHMIPTKIIALDTFPHLPNGKVDKKRLAELGKENQVHTKTTQVLPKTKTQEKLCAIWEEILKVSPIGIHDNFFELGGDSILSIQIIAKSRKMGMVFTPKQLFENQTIAELSVFVKESEEKENQKIELVHGETPLTPIQHWFFETHKSAPHFWNQGIKITGLPDLNLSSAEKATKAMLHQHGALRSVFKKSNDIWAAAILKPENSAPAFLNIDITHVETNQIDANIAKELEIIQNNLDLSEGSLFKCVYFSTNDESEDVAVLLAHHLVIDVVSWKIVIDDFLGFIKDTSKANSFKTSSVKDWGMYLQSTSTAVSDEIEFWKEQIQESFELPTDSKGRLPIEEETIQTVVSQLDSSLTESLIGNANDTFNTKIDELILTALVECLGKWSNKNTLTIALERHGREMMNTAIDVSNTVGWFTSFFPLKFETRLEENFDAKIIAVKEHMRKVPNGGVGYGVLRYLDKKLGTVDYPQIVFNFLGKQEITNSNLEFLKDGVRHPLSERNYLLEINAEIKEEKLTMNWSYSSQHLQASTIDKLISNFNTAVKEIIERCSDDKDGKFTPSDFPEAGLSQDDLDSLMSQF